MTTGISELIRPTSKQTNSVKLPGCVPGAVFPYEGHTEEEAGDGEVLTGIGKPAKACTGRDRIIINITKQAT
jgi:hypothetical protein